MRGLVPLLLLFISVLCCAEPATVIRAVDLKKEPASDAQSVATVPENSKVETLERKGGWVRVKAGEVNGWVRMLVLRYGAAQAAQGSEASEAAIDRTVFRMFMGPRTETSNAEVTTGVRGLDPEKLQAAKPNADELKKMETFASDPEAAGSFAGSGKLQPRQIDYPSK